jgi:glycosyltransferase involved in cell wall biosynthesis
MVASDGLPVEFAGWQDDIGAVLSNLDLLVVPSRIDSTPRVILEAFAAGVPVVAFPSGGIPEILKDGETGFLTAADTAKALAVRIADILTMPQAQLNSVVEQAYQSWQDNFTLEHYRQHVSDIIGQMCNPHGTLTVREGLPATEP